MKKILLMLGLVIVLGGVCLWFFLTPEKLTPENPAGKTIYYTIISDSGIHDNNGRYDYELTAYNKNGKEKKLEFSAGKQLREGAYIQLNYTRIRGVTYWEEIAFEELPEAVQQKYQK
ncbi:MULTISPECIES: YxeA family protein [unclassified Lysinibacillus]|uniref:YxeA family protein n=1 Tax=unclassified Lysinibacillus TaxID=2636778 RepID=UPI002556C071|nr:MULTISPECIES: YxeA family protein [unclassified Lysinibacillus]MDM5246634.1 YxeA family protein [Lysinibacillus sp. G4S2]